jgi:hypothetical protein
VVSGRIIEPKHLKKTMKKILAVMVIGACLYACSDGKINEAKIDSAGAKLQTTVEKSADSVASKVGRWKDSIDRNRDTSISH